MGRRVLLVVAYLGVFAGLLGCSGAGSKQSYWRYPKAEAAAAQALVLLGEQSEKLDDRSTDPEWREARLRYIRGVRERIVEMDEIRFDLMTTPMTRSQAEVVDAAAKTAYDHAIFLARYPGMLGEDGRPMGETPSLDQRDLAGLMRRR